jgi:hypothetical protein
MSKRLQIFLEDREFRVQRIAQGRRVLAETERGYLGESSR